MAALPAVVGAGAAFPFEHVAKATLIIAAVAFVANPFPSARLYSVATVVIVQFAGTGEPPRIPPVRARRRAERRGARLVPAVKNKWEAGRAQLAAEAQAANDKLE